MMIAAINALVPQTPKVETTTGPASPDLQRSAGPIHARSPPVLHCDGEFLSWGTEEPASSVLLCAVETWNCRSSSRATVRFRDADNPPLRGEQKSGDSLPAVPAKHGAGQSGRLLRSDRDRSCQSPGAGKETRNV